MASCRAVKRKAKARKVSGSKPAATRASAKPRPRAAKKATAAASTARGKATARRPGARRPSARADFGAPIDGFFAKQPAHLREILEALRELVEAVVPEASASIKWGMPFYVLGGKMMCALGAHKAHVNLILSGPAGAFDDPDGLLSGESKLGRHMKLTRLEELPRERVRAWLKRAARLAIGPARAREG